MDLLLDTHVLLWHLTDNTRLPLTYSNLIQNPEHRKFLSIASLWEIAIKTSTGKLLLSTSLDQLIPQGVEILPVRLPHLQHLQTLPIHHRDPFDRLLIAQALTEGLRLLSVDSQFAAYGIAQL